MNRETSAHFRILRETRRSKSRLKGGLGAGSEKSGLRGTWAGCSLCTRALQVVSLAAETSRAQASTCHAGHATPKVGPGLLPRLQLS